MCPSRKHDIFHTSCFKSENLEINGVKFPRLGPTELNNGDNVVLLCSGSRHLAPCFAAQYILHIVHSFPLTVLSYVYTKPLNSYAPTSLRVRSVLP